MRNSPVSFIKKEFEDLLDPEAYAARIEFNDFPGETFRALKNKEIKQYGEYRTRRLILEAWERLAKKGRMEIS